jgi:hypothetical protein
MNDKVLCQTFVLSLSRLERSWEIKSSRRLFERLWLRLIFRFKFSIVRYTDHVARSSWCWESMILSFDINKKIIVVLSKTSFCFFYHQFSMCISEYIFSLSSLNCRMRAYEKFAKNDECSMRNLISFIMSRYWIWITSFNSSFISDEMLIFCSIHLSFETSMILFNWHNHSSSFLKFNCSWKKIIREFLKNLFTSFFVFSLWCNQRANS